MKISLMTLHMYFKMLSEYHEDRDFGKLEASYLKMLDLVKECGYSAVDVLAAETEVFSVDKVKEYLEKRNLKVASYIYMAQFAAMDDSGFEKRIVQAKEAVDIAVSLDTKVLMLVPQAYEGIEQFTPEQIRNRLVQHFLPIMKYAIDKGIHVVVEDTPDLRLHFCTIAQVKEVMDQVPGLEMVYDSGNMILVKEDPVDYYEAFAKRVAHVHLKDMRYRADDDMHADTTIDGKKMDVAPSGTGLIDLQSVVDHLKKHHYEGYVTIEFIEDDDKDYRKSLIRSRGYIESLL